MYEGALGRQYADGEVICHQGEPGDGMYIIQAGRATVEREDDGTTVFVAELKAGDIFGEMALVERQPRVATVRAAGTARVLTLDRRAFMRQVHEDPSLAYRILEIMSRRIRNLDAQLSGLRRSSALDGGNPSVTASGERIGAAP